MTLLGPWLLVLLAALTVVVPLLAFLLWSRLRGPRPVRVVARLAMVLVSQLVALCLVVAAINDYAYFYKSWSEMAHGLTQIAGLGSSKEPASPQQISDRGGSTPASAGRISVHSYPSYSSPAEWQTRGRLESVQIYGGISRLQSHAYVYLPPQYFQPQYAGSYFPAAEVFTGYPRNRSVPGVPVEVSGRVAAARERGSSATDDPGHAASVGDVPP